ncbi:MAG: heavy-metal-associated domain-containing protein [Planctomycetaceae bacterium]|nr:heavy-metal-associated domain-containing protein [Planctomycetaceae bacterium]
MKNPQAILMMFLLVGCAESVDSVVSDPAESAASPTVTTVSFNAGDQATMEVPHMSCAIMCYPKVKDALSSIDGVAAVELVPQEEEGVINDHRVTVQFDGSVDQSVAIAALDKAGFPESKFEN